MTKSALLSKIDDDMCPPFSVHIENGEVSICNDNHIIAVLLVGGKHAEPLAELIVQACNLYSFSATWNKK